MQQPSVICEQRAAVILSEFVMWLSTLRNTVELIKIFPQTACIECFRKIIVFIKKYFSIGFENKEISCTITCEHKAIRSDFTQITICLFFNFSKAVNNAVNDLCFSVIRIDHYFVNAVTDFENVKQFSR